MHEKKIENILNQLSKIVDEAPNARVKSDHLFSHERVLARGERCFYLTDESLKTYNQLLKNLLNKEKWGEKFSEKYIDSVLVDTIFEFLEDGIEGASKAFHRACQNVEDFSTEQTIYIPLGGILMYDLEEIFLGKVKINRMTETNLEKILESIHEIIRLSKNSVEEQEYFIEESDKSLSKALFNNVCSVHKVVAEPLRAIEIAEQETHRALDLLRYSIPALYSNKDKVQIDLLSQVPSSFQPSLALSALGFVQNRKRANRFYELSKSNLEALKKLHIFELSEILRKPYSQINAFEETLLRGIHWFSSSQTQTEIENEFLNLTTCLEVFFTPEGGGSISSSIAEGVAIVLGRDLTERKNLKKRVKELYGLRSKISHGGYSTVSIKDIIELKSIAAQLLITMTEWSSNFSGRDQLKDWLEDQKLS